MDFWDTIERRKTTERRAAFHKEFRRPERWRWDSNKECGCLCRKTATNPRRMDTRRSIKRLKKFKFKRFLLNLRFEKDNRGRH